MRFRNILKILKNGNESEITNLFKSYNLIVLKYIRICDGGISLKHALRVSTSVKSYFYIDLKVEYYSRNDPGTIYYDTPCIGHLFDDADVKIRSKKEFDKLIKDFIYSSTNREDLDICVSGYKE